MRWLCWCSAALVLAGCGRGARPTADPFAYDHARPLAVAYGGDFASGPRATIRNLTFTGANGSRVSALLVVPRIGGRLPGVLFLHGSGGSRLDFVLEAARLGLEGAVTMTISQPNDVETYRPLVVNARRALDLLAARADVDPSRLGVVGFSLGAQTAAILAGDDSRLKTAGIIGGRGTPVTRYWIRRTHASLFFQAGTLDDHVPHAQLLALMRAAPGHPLIRWYRVGHVITRRIDADQLAWQARELRVGHARE